MAISGPMVQRQKMFRFSTGFGGGLLLSALAASGGCASSTPSSAAANTPASEKASAPPVADDSLSHGGASVFVVHLMSDFDAFKKYFEDGAGARAQAGIQGHLLTRLDDGRVVVLLFADASEKVEAALKSPEMARYLDRTGAPQSSLVWVTENELVKLPKVAPTAQTFSLYLKLRVTDFAALAEGFKQNLPLFAEHEVIGEGLHRSTSKEDIAILHFVGTSRDKLEALVKSSAFSALLVRAGSRDAERPLVGVDVSRSRPAAVEQ